MKYTRRQTLQQLLGAGALLGLRSLASGLPISVLANPRSALAQSATGTAALPPQFLVLSTSASGDPLNANVPGCYINPNVMHPQQASMKPTAMTLGSQTVTGAAPWASLPQSVLDRSAFLHHATTTVVHPDEPKVLQLFGAVGNHDNLLSMLAQPLSKALGTVQAAPVSLGAQGSAEYVSFQGRPQAPLSPVALATVLGDPTSPLQTLQDLRDQDLNALNQWFKANGNSAQASFIDRYATSAAQTRQVSHNLLGALANIKDNSVPSQLATASILIQMKLAPVFTVHLDFGGDNHTDTNLNGEANAQVYSIGQIKTFLANLATAGVADQVTFATLNVFGRTLSIAQNYVGRNHQANHHCMVLIGKNVQAGVIGGVQPAYGDYAAMPIDSKTGMGSAAGDINLTQSLPSAGKTLGAALGIDQATLDAQITGGSVIRAAIAG